MQRLWDGKLSHSTSIAGRCELWRGESQGMLEMESCLKSGRAALSDCEEGGSPVPFSLTSWKLKSVFWESRVFFPFLFLIDGGNPGADDHLSNRTNGPFPSTHGLHPTIDPDYSRLLSSVFTKVAAFPCIMKPGHNNWVTLRFKSKIRKNPKTNVFRQIGKFNDRIWLKALLIMSEYTYYV